MMLWRALKKALMEFANIAAKKSAKAACWRGRFPAPASNAKANCKKTYKFFLQNYKFNYEFTNTLLLRFAKQLYLYILQFLRNMPIKQSELGTNLIMPVIAGIFVIFDRFFKIMAISGCFNKPVDLIGDYFRLNFAGNSNIAFSLPLSGRSASAIISLIMAILIVYAAVLIKKYKYNQAFLLLAVILGAASNLFDRLRYGFVIDYFDLKYFTVFNLADILIVFGLLFVFTNKVPNNAQH